MYERRFTLRHAFKNFPELKFAESPMEEHFGASWNMQARREGDWLSLSFFCGREADENAPWKIEVDFELRVVSLTGKDRPSKKATATFEKRDGLGWRNFWSWDHTIGYLMVDETVVVECEVTIMKMSGIAQKRRFDFKEKTDLTDVILLIGTEKFNVSKMLLGTFSSRFHEMLFADSKNNEFVVDTFENPESFRSFLETIHGEPGITGENVENMLNLANEFDVKIVRDRCEDYLIHCKDTTDKKKFRLADTYELTNLKDHCLKSVKGVKSVRELLPGDIRSLSYNTIATLLEKTVSAP